MSRILISSLCVWSPGTFHHHTLNLFVTLFVLLSSQIFVISQAEPRLPLQLEDAVRPDGEGEEVRMNAWMDELVWKVNFSHDPQ